MNIFQTYKEQFQAMVKPQIITGKAKNIDTSKKVFDLVKDDGGADLVEVRMRCVVNSSTKGIWVQPKDKAACVVVVLNGTEYGTMLLACEEFETLDMATDGGATFKITSAGKIELNGNTYNLLKDTDTKNELNKMKARLNAVISCLSTGSNLAGAVTFSGLPSVTALPSENFSTIENQNVKHG